MDDANTPEEQSSEPLSQAARIIVKFGGQAKLANALGHANYSTVQGWQKSGFIRPKYHDDILAAAKRLNIKLTLDDFVIVDPSHEYFADTPDTHLQPQEA